MTKRNYDPQVISDRLRELMEKKGISQKDLAEKIGCSRKTINHYCLGKSVPDQVNAKALAAFFRVNEDYILGESEYTTSWHKYTQEHPEYESRIRSELGLIEYLDSMGCLPKLDEDEFESFLNEINEFIKFKYNQLKEK